MGSESQQSVKLIMPAFEYQVQNRSESLWSTFYRFLKGYGRCECYLYDEAYLVDFADTYLKDSSGIFSIFSDHKLTHRDLGTFLCEHYPGSRAPKLREDMIARKSYGPLHKIFDEDFGRRTTPTGGYMADFTKRCSKGKNQIGGANGVPLTVRILCYRLPEGDCEVGPVPMAGAPGVVPDLTKRELEKKGVNLSRLEKLGISIPSKDDAKVDVRNPYGYPLVVFDKLPLVEHSEHFYPPDKDDGERVVVRSILRQDGHECFRTDATQSPDSWNQLRYIRLVSEYRSQNYPHVGGKRPAVCKK